MNEMSRSNRILGYSFLASLAINFAWIAWVSHSGIFGSAGSIAGLHPQQIRLYTPILVKPRPKLRPIKPIRVIAPPPRPAPHRVARVQPPRAVLLPKPAASLPRRMPPPIQRMALLPKPTLPSKPQAVFHPRIPAPARRPAPPKAAGPKGSAAPMSGAGVPIMTDTSGASGGPASPGARRPGPDLLAQRLGDPTSPLSGGSGGNGPIIPHNLVPDDSGARENPHSNAPPSVERHDDTKKPLNYDSTTEQRAEPEAIGGFSAPDTSDLDASTITSDCILTIEVNEEGHVSQVHIKHSSGNRDFDNRCIEIAKRKRFRPAVQNHLAYPSRFQQTWSPGG